MERGDRKGGSDEHVLMLHRSLAIESVYAGSTTREDIKVVTEML